MRGWWIQVQSPLTHDPDGSLLLRAGLVDRTERWLQTGRIGAFSFLHKPPGIRVRFSTNDPAFERDLRQWLDAGRSGPWTTGFYEAEIHQFGGAAGAELAHRFFTAESLAALQYRERSTLGGNGLTPYQFSLLSLHAMFSAAAGDAWEEWDVWCHHRLTGRVQENDIIAAESLASFREALLPLFADPQGHMTDDEGAAWNRYTDEVRTIAPCVREAAQSGKLLWPLRQILPFWSIFHWNRMAFGLECQRRLAIMMIAVLSPKW